MQEVAGEPCLITAIKDGDKGPTGNGVVTEEFYYLRTALSTAPSAPSSGSAFTITYNGSTLTWSSSQPVPDTNNPYVWRCIRTRWSDSGWKWGGVELFDTYKPQIRVLSIENWTNGKKVYKGDAGEPFRDVFLSTQGGGMFFECVGSGTARSGATPDKMTNVYYTVIDGEQKPLYEDTGAPTGTGSKWTTGTYWPSFATSLLIALQAYIDSLWVRRLETVSDNGLGTRIEEGMIRIFDSNSDQWACFGFDSNGRLKLQFWRGSNLEIDYGPDAVFTLVDKKDSEWPAVELASWGGSAPAANNTFTLYPSSVTTYFRYVEGWTKVSNAKRYVVSQNGLPSSYNGKLFQTRKTDADMRNGSIPNYIPNGYYRKKASFSEQFLQEASNYVEPVNQGSAPTGNVAVGTYKMSVYYYSSGTLSITYEVTFEKLSNGTQGKVVSVKTL